MALMRYLHLGRKMGVVPALRQLATTPRRRLASGTSQSSLHQGGHDNGDGRPMTDADVARLKAEFTAKCNRAIEALRKEEASRRFLFKSCATGVGVALLAVFYTAHTEWERGKRLRKILLE